MAAEGGRANQQNAGTPGPGCGPTQKKCEACGETFSCSAPERGCWCEEVKLSNETRESLRAQFADCLCPKCLAAAAVRK